MRILLIEDDMLIDDVRITLGKMGFSVDNFWVVEKCALLMR